MEYNICMHTKSVMLSISVQTKIHMIHILVDSTKYHY